ncbi:hypothetical protein EXIGLDRAFT_703759 [Exidia glandulosa HHB12029]|uniref:Uncharacterized protein n=1 Tax=Exidia glandulosa HHB12029 TaxID=1314781 RepID=A0A165BZL2_EXIGL|nr:hypothetical protein EXIGLDRAFT_703759 [Exidia glandulosa HHB12029]
MAGRPRIYRDKKERQRAYYERHKERQQERSRARYARLHPQAQSSKRTIALDTENVTPDNSVSNEETDEDGLYRQRLSILSRTTFDLGAEWEITPDTRLEELLFSLTADLRRWRKGAETDREEYELIARHALQLKSEQQPLSAFVEFVCERRLVFMAVADLAQRAEDQVRKSDPARTIQHSQDWAAWNVHVSGSLCEAFADLKRTAGVIEKNVQEMGIFYGVGDVLRTMYTSGRLRWQVT